MFAKLFQNHVKGNSSPTSQQNARKGLLKSSDFDLRVTLHYGIPSTASILAFDPIQSLLAVGTLDGRIKVIGGDNIEGLLISPKRMPFKYLEFLCNRGFLVGVSNDNEIQVWNLEHRRIAATLHWESNITAFSITYGSSYMYIGSEHAIVAILKFDEENEKIVQTPYSIFANVIAEEIGVEVPNNLSVVGVLHQTCSGNRVLIAYENGLIILWDAREDRVALFRGHEYLQLENVPTDKSPKDTKQELLNEVSDSQDIEKEICSLCLVSSDGSVLAVGYVDGDILFWNLSTSTRDQKANKLARNVVKLQLSSGNRRLPVIVLHWSASETQDHEGKLFVYGGDEIGSIEVLTILSLDFSSGIEGLKCVGRIDITLSGTFADMVLSPPVDTVKRGGTLLFVLTNPGQLDVYQDSYLSSLISQKEKTCHVSTLQYTMVVPNVEPCITVVKLGLIQDSEFSRALVEVLLSSKLQAPHSQTLEDKKWPLTGGLPSALYNADNYRVERLYIAGYQDGSIRIWDATYSALALIFHLDSEVKGVEVAASSTSVSALDVCPVTLRLAVGNQYGLVRLYELVGSSHTATSHFMTESGTEVHRPHRGEMPQCAGVFDLLNSSVVTLQFGNFGAILAVGFECGRVAMIDVNTQSPLFVTGDLSNLSPVISLAINSLSDTCSLVTTPGKRLLFILTRDSKVSIIDITTGNVISTPSIFPEKESTAISMYIIGGEDKESELSGGKISFNDPQVSKEQNESLPTDDFSEDTTSELQRSTNDISLKHSFILVCCETTLYLDSLMSVIEGESKSAHKVNLLTPCCWTTTFKKDGKECGLVLLYPSGDIEIRSLPSFEVVEESSLMSILRWNFKANMDKMICSSDNGQITLMNGSEFAVISLLAQENDLRLPESLPCLYDKVLAAAVSDATINVSPQNKRQSAGIGILDGVIKGLKGNLGGNDHNIGGNYQAHLDSLFSSPPFLKPSKEIDDQNPFELDIDDIKLDEPVAVLISSKISKNEKKAEGTERERLFEGGASSDTKPKVRTAEEIKAKYRHAGDASAAAAQARNKLMERGEKLEKLSQRTEDLRNGAENFADMAKELAKSMENRKWWQI